MMKAVQLQHFFSALLTCALLVGLLSCGSDKGVGPEPEPEPEPDPTMPNHLHEGDLVIDLSDGIKIAFTWIEPGTFRMGTADSILGHIYDAERPQHEVTLTEGFYIGRFEVTQRQWHHIMRSAPWIGTEDSVHIGPHKPAMHIAFPDIQAFLTKLNQSTLDGVYRLPTEAEWEYACRAGTQGLWSWGNEGADAEDYAWYETNSYRHLHQVGRKLPNPWGLYDMHGNVIEWVQDYYGFYSSEPRINPLGSPLPFPGDAPYIGRGGDFESDLNGIRSAKRNLVEFPSTKKGIRLVREGPKVVSK